jgi:copper(I)-binding protein
MLRTRIFASVVVSTLAALAYAPAHAGQPMLHVADDGRTSGAMAGMFMPVKAGDLEITAAAIKATTPGQPVGGGFLTIVNHGSQDDRLVSVTVKADVRTVELHEMAMSNDVMTMRKLKDGLPLPAGQTVEMKPGGLHMMIMGVKAPFRPGETVHAVLEFEKAGKVEIDMPVEDMRPGMQNMKM